MDATSGSGARESHFQDTSLVAGAGASSRLVGENGCSSENAKLAMGPRALPLGAWSPGGDIAPSRAPAWAARGSVTGNMSGATRGRIAYCRAVQCIMLTFLLSTCCLTLRLLLMLPLTPIDARSGSGLTRFACNANNPPDTCSHGISPWCAWAVAAVSSEGLTCHLETQDPRNESRCWVRSAVWSAATHSPDFPPPNALPTDDPRPPTIRWGPRGKYL
jgi:hypothetical protein